MMPLDSWIDEEALAMMRALAPKPSSPPDAPARTVSALPEQESALFSTESEERQAVTSPPAPPRIARPDEANPEAVERMRQRLADIRRRAENRGIVRANPAPAQPAPPVAPVEEPPPPPPEPAIETVPLPSPEPVAAPSTPAVSQPAPNGPTGPTSPAVPETTWIEPAIVESALAGVLPAIPEPRLPIPLPKPLLPPLEIEETWESESLPPLESPPSAKQPVASGPAPIADSPPPVLPTAPMPSTEGPLSVRIAAFRHWLETDCGFTTSVVIDQRGNTLHPADGQEAMVAVAASLGSAWAEACAMANPGAQPKAAHSAWGGQTLAVVPVPTRFGDLHVAGTVQSAVGPELATSIADALRKAAGV